MDNRDDVTPIYTTTGEPVAFIKTTHIYNRDGEWVGYTNSRREVFSILGNYVGYLTKDPRILRKRVEELLHPAPPIPPAPARIYPPATIPLAPLMSELSYDIMDVLLEAPELLHPVDSGELRPDLD